MSVFLDGSRGQVLRPQPAAASDQPRLRTVGIVGLGSECPTDVVSNADLEQLVDTTDQWILERTGIRQRRKAAPGTPTSDLAAAAGRKALANAGLAPEQLDLIVVATATPDCPVPSTACFVQQKLGAVHAAGFDLAMGCAGFSAALMTARSLVATGQFDNALVLGAEVLTSILDYSDRTSCILFGDGAGAAVIQAEPDRGLILDNLAGMDGRGTGAIQVPAGGSACPATPETVAARKHFIHMEGRKVFKFAVQCIEESTRKLLERNGYTLDDLDLLVPHQANLRIIEAAAERLSLPMDKVAVHIESVGNTSSASIPMTLERMAQAGRLRQGDLVCTVGFGAGLAWAANLLRW